MMPSLSIQIGRSVGFVSAVVGLLCYALSSSFHHLFGDWNLFKFFLYFIFTFIISSITLFAKKPRQRLLSPHFKTHMALFVLIATNVYSFFYDKAVNEKPDVYILLSCVAFAVMCLSLSTRTECGCEPDIANFFLGCLIILLMKINLWLTFVGIGFSYSLIIVIFPYYLDAIAYESTPESGFSGDYIAVPMDLLEAVNNGGIQGNPQHINSDSVIQMDSLLNGALIMTQFKACISALQRLDDIMLHELYTYVDKYLEDSEFLIGNPISQVPTDDNLLIDSLPSETINSLHETVKLVMAAGFEEECCRLYSRCRSQFLQKFMLRLQLSDFNIGGSHPALIQQWMKACYTALRILFPWERRLCHRVFSGFSYAADLSFMKVCKELTNDLLNFPNNLTIESLSLTYVQKNLKVFRTLSELMPEFESVFCDNCSVSLKNEAIASLGRLREVNMLLFNKLERLREEDMRLERLREENRFMEDNKGVIRLIFNNLQRSTEEYRRLREENRLVEENRSDFNMLKRLREEDRRLRTLMEGDRLLEEYKAVNRLVFNKLERSREEDRRLREENKLVEEKKSAIRLFFSELEELRKEDRRWREEDRLGKEIGYALNIVMAGITRERRLLLEERFMEEYKSASRLGFNKLERSREIDRRLREVDRRLREEDRREEDRRLREEDWRLRRLMEEDRLLKEYKSANRLVLNKLERSREEDRRLREEYMRLRLRLTEEYILVEEKKSEIRLFFSELEKLRKEDRRLREEDRRLKEENRLVEAYKSAGQHCRYAFRRPPPSAIGLHFRSSAHRR